jgi:peptidoglycan/xylan/chitin deacetylase (PgdA/CDA1 family)
MAVLLVSPAVAVASLAMPARALAANPSPAAPMTVRLEAGTHTGYRFDATLRTVTSTKTATLIRPAGTSTTRRALIPGRGVHLLIASGTWAGYWLPESIVAHAVGVVGDAPFSPARRITFPAGEVLGYRFNTAWAMSAAKVLRLDHVSGANADRAAAINGTIYYHIVNGGLANYWVPAGAPGAVRPLACRTGPRATGGQQVLRRVAGAGPEVALTFDLGGRTDPAIAILRRLLLNGVCTTIFPTGVTSQTPAGQHVLAVVRAYPQVFEVGNHTMHHCDLVRGGGGTPASACATGGPPSASFVRTELTDAAAIIQSGSGQSPVPYWRPPYGATSAAVQNTVAAIGYTKTAMWDVDTIDWLPEADGGPTPSSMSAKVLGNATNGSIVLMHLGGFNTADALPMMIHGLRQRGLAPSTVSDLLDGT